MEVKNKKMRNKAEMLVALAAAFLCIASFSSVASAQVQTYYVLGDEADSLLRAYENTSYGNIGGWVNGTVSIVAWEPVNVTIDKDEIAGYNGVDDFKVLSTGEIWTLDTSDLGKDYIRANGSISVVRTAWWFNASLANLPGKFVAGTWELYPTGAWGKHYVVPINTIHTELIVQAKEANTDVTVGAGPAVTLNRGEDKHFADVPAKTKVTATKPVQAGILTNKGLGGGYGWDTRFFTLTPRSLLGNDYYIPVPSFEENYTKDSSMVATPPVPTNLTIYAFNATQVTIEDGTGFTTTFTMGADTIDENYMMPEIPGGYINEGDPWLSGGYAAHVSGNDTIWVLGSCDNTDDDYDWGFQSLNTSLLMNYYYIPWSPANPAYVTPVADTTFYVDLDVDGTEEYSFTLKKLNMSTIYPNSTKYKVAPLNLTGAKIWTDGDVPFAIQWGQDNYEDTPGERAVNTSADNDFGYTVLPLQQLPTLAPDIGIVKLVDDVKSKIVVHNQTVTFTLNVTNTGNAALKEIVVNDTLPAKLTFVNATPAQDSATTNADGTMTIIWKSNLAAELEPGNYTLITFNATIDPDAETGVMYTNWVTVNATSDYGDAGPKDDSASVRLRRPSKVPVLTPFGIAALIGLLSLVVVLSIHKSKGKG